MKNKNVIIILLLLVLLIVSYYLNNTGRSRSTYTGEKTGLAMEEPQQEIDVVLLDRSDPIVVVGNFMENFVSASPPAINQEALKSAVGLLSEGAKASMNESPIAGNLAMLLGVQDVPNEGYEIGEVVYKDNKASGIEDSLAEINVVLKYPGGDTERLFLLSKIDNMWQIDGIRLENN